jgi:hypothetical protein
MNSQVLVTFLPALVYLLLVTGLVLAKRRVPEQVHLVALVAGVAVRIVQDGWGSSLLAVGAAAIALILGVLLTARLITGVTLFTLCTAIALLPLATGWLGVCLGLALAGVVSLVRMLRTYGRDRVNLVTFETMSALGALPGVLGQVDLDRMPTREDADLAVEAQQADETAGPVKGMRMYLPPYLLIGATLAGVLASLT